MQPATYAVLENATSGTVIGQPLAWDRANYTLTWRLATGGFGKFVIAPTTGVITLVGPLVYEQTNVYYLQIDVTNAPPDPTTALSTAATIVVNVLHVRACWGC